MKSMDNLSGMKVNVLKPSKLLGNPPRDLSFEKITRIPDLMSSLILQSHFPKTARSTLINDFAFLHIFRGCMFITYGLVIRKELGKELILENIGSFCRLKQD